MRPTKKLLAGLSALAVVAVVPGVVANDAEAATGLPTYVETVHGPGTADMYPVDVTTSNGRYYVVDPGRYRVVAVSQATGRVVDQVGGVKSGAPGQLSAARGIDHDPAGNLYVADSANNRVQVFDSDLNYVRQWGGPGDGSGRFRNVYDTAFGPGRLAGGGSGNVVYTTDQDRVQKFTPTGQFISVFASGLNQPRQLIVRPGTSDLFVVNARSREIIVYAASGAVKGRFGSQGAGNGQFNGDPRGITFTPDGQTVLVSDDGNGRIQAFDADTYQHRYNISGFVDVRGIAVAGDTLVATDEWDYSLKEFDLGASGQPLLRRLFGGPPPQSGVNSPRGMDVDSSGRLYVTDWWNQRIVRSNASGGAYTSWGQRGTRTQLGRLNFAWDLAVQPGTNRVFVANRESHEIEVFTSSGTPVVGWGHRSSAPGQFTFPNGVAFGPDGTLWVSDSGNNRIQNFAIAADGTGTLIGAYGSGGSGAGRFNVPVGVDVAADGTVWVADQKNFRLQSRNPNTGVWTVHSGPSNDHFRPMSVNVAPDGELWAGDASGGQVHIFSSDGSWSRSFTGPDVGAPAMREPFDIVFGNGTDVFVSDVWNNRVLRLSYGGSSGGPDLSAPNLTVTRPVNNEVFTSRPVAMTGSASDNVGVDSVTVAVQNRVTKQWRQTDGSWGGFASRAMAPANLGTPGGSTSTWSWSFDPGVNGLFGAQIEAFDAAGNASGRQWRSFEIDVTGGPDSVAPGVGVTNPSQGENFASRPVVLRGNATDNVGVTRVTVAVQDRVSKRWLQADGSFGPWSTRLQDASLASPGAGSTAWSYAFNPGGPGQYTVGVRSYDAAGNTSNQVWRRFDITG